MYIVFEGIDGSGKDTQLELALDFLIKDNKYNQILKTQEPSGITKYGKEITKRLGGEGFESPLEAMNLYIADRLEMNNLKKEINDTTFILSSRGDYTTYAYQSQDLGGNKGFTFDFINDQHKKDGDNLLIPDITFFFDIPGKEAINRIKNRLKLETGVENSKLDFFEKEDFLENSREQYKKAFKYLYEKEGRKIYILDATKSIDDIHKEVINIIKDNIIL